MNRNNRIPRLNIASLSAPEQVRAAVTLACRDTDSIPKVSGAGEIQCLGNTYIQKMHEGTFIEANAYEGNWITKIIFDLKGHHEPQEELLFHSLLSEIRPGTQIVELGSYWAYYSNWYLGAIENSKAVCIEPNMVNLEVGKRNLALNNRQATFIHARVGEEYSPSHSAETKPADDEFSFDSVECLNMQALHERLDHNFVEMLHMDVQGAELGFLRSIAASGNQSNLRFVVVSTHHKYITGSPNTHADCLETLRESGAVILAEHSVAESFSGDGLIIASFQTADATIDLPPFSRADKNFSKLIWEPFDYVKNF